jgi:hypothetical protein
MPSLIRLMFVHGATALVACGLIFGLFLLMRAFVQCLSVVCSFTSLGQHPWVRISYIGYIFRLAAALEGTPQGAITAVH